jgi:hypothetical protein
VHNQIVSHAYLLQVQAAWCDVAMACIFTCLNVLSAYTYKNGTRLVKLQS